MKFLDEMASSVIPSIDPERIVTRIYGPNGVKKLHSPTKAKDLNCYGCGSDQGYLNFAWDAWCCQNEKCWGSWRVEGETSKEELPYVQPKIIKDLLPFGIPFSHKDASLKDAKLIESKKAHFGAWIKKPEGFLVFSGSAGTGKTYLACALLSEYFEKSYNFRFVNCADLNYEYRSETSNGKAGQDCYGKYCGIEFLVIDDIGIRTPGEGFLELLYAIINKRIESGKPTIFTTNLNGEGLEKKFGEAMTSRLLSGQVHEFLGKDRRPWAKGERKVENLF